MVDPHGYDETHRPDEHREDCDEWELDDWDVCDDWGFCNDWAWFGLYLVLTVVLGVCIYFAISLLSLLGF